MVKEGVRHKHLSASYWPKPLSADPKPAGDRHRPYSGEIDQSDNIFLVLFFLVSGECSRRRRYKRPLDGARLAAVKFDGQRQRLILRSGNIAPPPNLLDYAYGPPLSIEVIANNIAVQGIKSSKS